MNNICSEIKETGLHVIDGDNKVPVYKKGGILCCDCSIIKVLSKKPLDHFAFAGEIPKDKKPNFSYNGIPIYVPANSISKALFYLDIPKHATDEFIKDMSAFAVLLNSAITVSIS